MERKQKRIISGILILALTMVMIVEAVPLPKFTMEVHATTRTVTKTAKWDMDGGKSGTTTKTDEYTLYTTSGGSLRWTCSNPNVNNIYLRYDPQDDETGRTSLRGDVLKYGGIVEFPNISGKVTKVEISNIMFNYGGVDTNGVANMYVGIDRNSTSSLLHIAGSTDDYDFPSTTNSDNTRSVTFEGNVDVNSANSLKLIFYGEAQQEEIYPVEVMFVGGSITVTYEMEEEITGDPGHSFSYTASGNTLTATCNQTDSNHACDLTDRKATLTLTANDNSYDGSLLKRFATLNTQDFVDATGLTGITSTFSYVNKSTNEVTSDGVVQPGEYTVTATITINETDYTLTKDFSISVNNHSITNNYSQFTLNKTTANPGDEITISVDRSISLTSLSVVGTTANLTLANNEIRYSDQNGVYFFRMPDEDVTINATFEAASFNISISDSIQHGSITAKVGTTENATTAQVGDTVTIVATPEEGYGLTALTYTPTGGDPVDILSTKSFTMPVNNVAVTATFELLPHAHSFTYSAAGAVITATCSNTDGNCTLENHEATLTVAAPSGDLTYDGTAKEATVSGTIPDITTPDIVYTKGGATFTGTPIEAGAYTASITVEGVTASASYTIAPKLITITGATATARDYAKDSRSVEISAVTFDGATLTKGTDYTVTGEIADDTVGDDKSVTVTVTLTNSNYTFGTNGNTTTTSVKINKIAHSEVTASGSAKYGNSGTVDLSALIEAGGSVGDISVTDTNSVLDGTPTIETNGKTLKFKFANESGSVDKNATVTIPVTGATNYNDYNIVVTLTVTDKTVPTLTVSDFTKTYDGDTVTISQITKTAKAGSSDVEGAWTFEGNPGLKDVSDSGTITVKFTPANTSNYESATATFTLTINRKAVTVKADNKSMIVGTTTEPELTATVSGTVGNDRVNYSVTREIGTEVGAYTITPSGDAEQGNYNVSYENGTFTITEDATTPVVKKAPKAITGLVYNGKAQALVESGEAENGTMVYAAVKAGEPEPASQLYTASIPSKTDAGTYYVWYKAKGTDGNKDSDTACVTVKIEEKQTDPQPATAEGGTKIEFVQPDASVSESEGEAPASAEGEGLDKLLSEEEKSAGVKYEMKVQPKSFAEVKSEGGEQIQEKAKEHYTEINTDGTQVKEVYLDMSIFKTVGDGNPEQQHSVNSVIHVWFPYNLKGRHYPMFWRFHGGEASAFTNSNSGEDGTFYVENEGTENAVVHTFSKEFSTYALTYLEGTVTYPSPEIKSENVPATSSSTSYGGSSSSSSSTSYSGSSSSGGSDGPISVGGIVSSGAGASVATTRIVTSDRIPAGMARKDVYGKGSVTISVNALNGIGGASANGILLGDTAKILAACLTPEELAAVSQGMPLEIRLNISEDAASITEAEKQQMAAGYPGLTIGQFLDITIDKKLGTAEWSRIPQTNGTLAILLDIPAALQAAGRSFSVIRSHDGVLSLLADMDADNMTVTIETGDFSAYALAYENAAGTAAAGAKATVKTNPSPAAPKTDDPLKDYLPLLAVYGIAFLAAAVLYKMKRRNA